MKNILKQFLTVLALMLAASSVAQDFTVNVPETDSKHNLIIPLKVGSSHQLQVLVKNNWSDTCVVSINEFYFGEPASWISIDNNNRTVYPRQTTSFILTINIPTDAQDRDYYMGLSFNAKKYPTNTSIGSFDYNTQTIIVDKSAPTQPGINVSSTSKTVTINNFSSWDDRSNTYTSWNDGTGLNGIKSYTVYLKLNGSVVENKSIEWNQSYYWTFTELPSNKNYTAGVTAIDLAGNTSSSETSVITAPAAPEPYLLEQKYCSIDLAWHQVSGAVIYDVYKSTNELVLSTSDTLCTVSPLEAGTAYSFFVKAKSSSGKVSDKSATLNTSTLSVPEPIIAGPSSKTVCSGGTTFSVSNKPTECTLSWLAGPGLTLYSTNGVEAVFKSTGNYTNTWVKAIFDAGCGTNEKPYNVDSGSPTPGPITILWDVPPRRFTAYITPIPSATSYKWYLDGVLKFDSPEYDVFFARQIWNCEHIYDVDVKAVNTCGESAISHTEVMEDPCDFTFKVYPNPASNEITVSPSDLNTKSTAFKATEEPATIKSIKIIDQSGNVYFEKQYKGTENKVKVNISFLKKGSYFVVINYLENNEEVLAIFKN